MSIFGIPKVIQSDQGSNFSSHLFAQVVKQLKVQHKQSSAYHAQSQGALERFHQTLKSLLRGSYVEMNQDWEEGLPWLMLAAREVVQESMSENVMSFGLRNAPSTFQRLMNRVVSGLEGCAVYLDDVVIYSDTWEAHLARIKRLFDWLSEACLTVNLAKCDFAKVVGQGCAVEAKSECDN